MLMSLASVRHASTSDVERNGTFWRCMPAPKKGFSADFAVRVTAREALAAIFV